MVSFCPIFLLCITIVWLTANTNVCKLNELQNNCKTIQIRVHIKPYLDGAAKEEHRYDTVCNTVYVRIKLKILKVLEKAVSDEMLQVLRCVVSPNACES